jgi:hypothetical protein
MASQVSVVVHSFPNSSVESSLKSKKINNTIHFLRLLQRIFFFNIQKKFLRGKKKTKKPTKDEAQTVSWT